MTKFPLPDGQPFKGSPLKEFNFGGAIGLTDFGTTDTIMLRTQTISKAAGQSLSGGVTTLQILALSMVSVGTFTVDADDKLHPDLSGQHLYVKLASETSSTGSMTIRINSDPDTGGTFHSSFDVYFHVFLGDNDILRDELFGCDLAGPCKLSLLSDENVKWGREAPPEALTIDNINYKLDQTDDIGGDFWPGELKEKHPCCGSHQVAFAVVPEPGTLILLGSALFGFGVLRRRMSRRSA
jgi:hypothetical protein